MKFPLSIACALALLLVTSASRADEYTDAVALFKNAGQSGAFFDSCYGYAIFPTIGKGGLVVGGAHGSGRVYVHGRYVGDTSMTQVSVGFQAGGQAYSQIVFFQDKRAFDEFTSHDFEFGADANAVAITILDKATFGGAATITLMFDPATFALKQWTVLDSQGLQTVVTLFNVDLSTTPEASLFKIDEQQRMLNSR